MVLGVINLDHLHYILVSIKIFQKKLNFYQIKVLLMFNVVLILQLHYQVFKFLILEFEEVYSFGYYGDGRLGLGDINDYIPMPVLIESLLHKNIIKIHSGGGHTFASSSNFKFNFR